MESPGSPYALSPDAAPKRSQRSECPSPDEKQKQTHIRFLVSNIGAGCIIGKGGSTISEIQSQSGARIQLSRNHELFPGTSDRIIMVSGSVDDIMKAMEQILEKLLTEDDDINDVENKLRVQLVVPNSSCGAIIGKGGSTIKSLIEESQAGIKVSSHDHTFVGLNDRLVTLTGTLDEQLRAIFLILSKLTEGTLYSQSIVSPYPYSGINFSGSLGMPVSYGFTPSAFNPVNYGANGSGGKYANNKASSARPTPGMPDASVSSKTIGVADDRIGAVVGRGGRNIMEISQVSGAKIKISDRGDFISGTSERKVAISGSQEAIVTAESMIMQKVLPGPER